MKFWELTSHCREEPALLGLLAENPAWAEFAEWAQNLGVLIAQQDRGKLDFELPDDLCRHVLSQSKLTYKVSGGWVRSSGSSLPGSPLSAIEVFDRYGGSFLEEVNEYGSCRIPSS